MTKLKTIVVEDEPLAMEGILAYIKDIEFIEVIASCENALDANKQLALQTIDLMFLDIQMPKISGIDFLKSLKKEVPIVILTTAYPNFALQGYELDVLDYLVKPFPFDRFLKAANKARDFFELKQNRLSDPTGTPGSVPQTEDYFFVKCDHRYEKIHFDEVLFVEGMENYVVVHTRTKQFITLLRMKNMEEILPATAFMRIHKSYVASIKAITSIDGNEVVIGTRRLPYQP